MRVASIFVIAAIGTACAHSPPPALHSTRLVVVHTTSGGFRPFVRAKVAGETVPLLLDTGAIHSLLPGSFAKRHNLPTRESRASDAQFVDANGTVRWMPALPNVPVQFEGEASGGTLDFYLNPSDPTNEGILAAQDLVRSGGALVIDLGREELRYEPEDAALTRVRAESSVPLREVDFQRCLLEGFFERAHRIVSTRINGVQAKMLIDTGASRTVLTRNNPALSSMMAVKGDRGQVLALTSTGQGLLVQDVPIVFSETSFVMPVLVQPVSQPCFEGALGADVLRQCIIVWGSKSLWAACRPPT
jgi:predicted aspartyl protease